jgi:hypothetical protein
MVLPLIGNMCFIPIITFLLDIFVCDETTGDDVDDAVLAKD